MKMKSFLLGLVAGIILTLVVLFIMGLAMQKSEETIHIKYLEQPVDYENKKETSFKIFQVFENAALANEVSNKEYKWYQGNTVIILGKNFYNDQVIVIKNPQRVGTYSYTNNGGVPMTVPVLDGNIYE